MLTIAITGGGVALPSFNPEVIQSNLLKLLDKQKPASPFHPKIASWAAFAMVKIK